MKLIYSSESTCVEGNVYGHTFMHPFVKPLMVRYEDDGEGLEVEKVVPSLHAIVM